MTDPALYLHRLVLKDPLGLHRLARKMRLPDQPYDSDYIMHSLLTELLGPGELRPFVVDPRSRGVAVLAYGKPDREKLEQKARAVAPPEIFGQIDWTSTDSKPMPDGWPQGQRLGFRVRVSPVVRGPQGHGQDGAKIDKRSPEVDAYLASCWQQHEKPEREAVYRNWLTRELGRDGAARPETLRMTGFRLKRSLRRDGERKARAITRPDAVFEGTLVIEESGAFGRLLERGLGRHRGFGFGMLLLTAPRN